MSVIKLITTVSLAVVLVTMITSNQLTIYASPTTEDDGWTEGDYEGSSEEQEEQAQDDWEDAGRPGETDDDDAENENDNNDNDDGLIEYVKYLLHVQTGQLLQHKQNVHQNQYQVLLHAQTDLLLQHKQNVHQYQQQHKNSFKHVKMDLLYPLTKHVWN